MEFTDWLDKQLKDRQWSPADLAAKSGLTKGAISHVFAGTRKPGVEFLNAVAQALKLPPDLVFQKAGILPTKADEDPWVEEMSHNLGKLTGLRRSIAESLVKSLIVAEEKESGSAAAPKATQPR